MPNDMLITKGADSGVDLLNRQPFVDRLIGIVELLAKNKKSACYAINGSWGVGKSYVLDMFEKQICNYGTEGTTLSKYLIFHYNCWQYDYYEEPLLAIISALMDTIEEGICILPVEQKEKIKYILREIGESLINDASTIVKKKTGINIKKWFSFYKNMQEEAQKKLEESYSFDPHFDFKKKLKKIQDTIGSLSEHQTVIIVVDELDRCMPEYAIKVLERLHHLFDGIYNVQVILSVDKKQLNNIILQTFGKETSVEKYLAKFIEFEIRLFPGMLNENYDIKFAEYVGKFEYLQSSTIVDDIKEFNKIFLEGIDIRTRIALLNKCMLLHDMLNGEAVHYDYSIMCIEVFLVLVKYANINFEHAKNRFDITNLFSVHNLWGLDSDNHVPVGLSWLNMKYSINGKYYIKDKSNAIIRTRDIWGLLLGCYRIILGFNEDDWDSLTYCKDSIEKYVIDYWQLLKSVF